MYKYSLVFLWALKLLMKLLVSELLTPDSCHLTPKKLC